MRDFFKMLVHPAFWEGTFEMLFYLGGGYSLGCDLRWYGSAVALPE